MRPYNEYEKLHENYSRMLNKKFAKVDYEVQKADLQLEPNDYVIFGNLMKEITESVKSPDGRENILASFGDENKGYAVKNEMSLAELMHVAICLAAALDKNVSDDKLFSLTNRYHLKYDLYKNVAQSEMLAESMKKQQ